MNITVEKHDRVTVIMINRPNVKNAVDRETAQQLADTFRQFDSDVDSDVAVLAGLGGSFCAGADLKSIAKGVSQNRMEADGDGPMGPTRMLLSKPVIAAISGYAVAGGLELALWCDLRVVESNAIMGVFCRRWGVPLIDGGTVRLPRLIGMSRAMDLILTGRPVNAEEALQIGLANRVVEPSEGLDAAIKLAVKLCEFPQQCLRNDRWSAYQQWSLTEDAAIANEFVLGLDSVASKEMIKGATRFTQGKGRHGNFEDI